jgi:hypothetical protein
MGLDPRQFLVWIVRPTLAHLNGQRTFAASSAHPVAVEKLLMMTTMHESAGLTYLDQLDRGVDDPGPAFGVIQMERATFDDTWDWLANRPAVREPVLALATFVMSVEDALRGNLHFQVAIARVHYYRRREALPAADDHAGLASYAKRYWNTSAGKATPGDYLRALERVAHLWP